MRNMNRKNLVYTIIFIQLLLFLITSCSKNDNKDKTNNIENTVTVTDNEDIIENNIVTENNIYSEWEKVNNKYDITEDPNMDNRTLSEEEILLIKIIENSFASLHSVGEADYGWIVGLGLRFNFPEKNNYAIIPGGPPFQPWLIGEFRIENEKIVLYPTSISVYGKEMDEIFKDKLELERITIDNSLYYTEGLTGKNIVFGAGGSGPSKGDIRYVNGHKIILDDHRECKLNSNARIRKGPGINYEFYSLKVFNEKWDMVIDTTYFLQGRSIYILGHTEFQETHDNLTGYWYYCQIWYSPYEEEAPSYGWIFGPLIDIE
jgi:hypothetical protein